MPGLALFLLRLLVWVVAPLLLLALAVGPLRSWRFARSVWARLTGGCEEPLDVFNRVVAEHEKKLEAQRELIRQAKSTRAEIEHNIERCEQNIRALEAEARTLARTGDDDGARAALARLELERIARQTFREQLERHRERQAQARKRLHLLELQLRQYEVGRSILLGQLAEARSVEQQYALANQFDPFSAVAEWRKAQGAVQEEARNARAAEQVLEDTAPLALTARPARLDPEQIEAELARLKAEE